jgi:hypothetical protein
MSKNDEWPVIRSLLPTGWDTKAVELGAFERTGSIKSPEHLLRTLLALAANKGGARSAAGALRASGIVEVTGEALRKRLRGAGAWLTWIAAELSEAFRKSPSPQIGGRRLRAIDSTTIQSPSARGTDFRLHYTIDLISLTCDWHELTDNRGAELLERAPIGKGDVLLGDRNFLRTAGVKAVVEASADVVVRLRANHELIRDEQGRVFDALDRARSVRVSRPKEWAVQLVGSQELAIPARVIIVKLPAPVARKSERKIKAKARRKQRRAGPKALRAASFFMLCTTLPESEFSTKAVLELYRFRWQIEIAFKRLKQILNLGHLPHKTKESGTAWIMAKLVLALLLEILYRNERSFSPWGYDLEQVLV